MRVNRGDVVLVDYPFTAGVGKVRPALVVQNDRDNARMANTIVAQISGNTARVNETTQHLIELAAEPGCGLTRDSALIATNLLTMHQISFPPPEFPGGAHDRRRKRERPLSYYD